MGADIFTKMGQGMWITYSFLQVIEENIIDLMDMRWLNGYSLKKLLFF